MSEEVQIRIFSLSRVEFEAGNLGNAIYWLMKKGDKPYYFREMTPRNFPAGSIVLFNFESQIFGQAITYEAIRKFTSDEQRDNEAKMGYPYKAAVRFVQSSIDVFCKYPSKEEVEKILGKGYSRNFTILNWKQYEEVLRLAGRRP